MHRWWLLPTRNPWTPSGWHYNQCLLPIRLQFMPIRKSCSNSNEQWSKLRCDSWRSSRNDIALLTRPRPRHRQGNGCSHGKSKWGRKISSIRSCQSIVRRSKIRSRKRSWKRNDEIERAWISSSYKRYSLNSLLSQEKLLQKWIINEKWILRIRSNLSNKFSYLNLKNKLGSENLMNLILKFSI